MEGSAALVAGAGAMNSSYEEPKSSDGIPVVGAGFIFRDVIGEPELQPRGSLSGVQVI